MHSPLSKLWCGTVSKHIPLTPRMYAQVQLTCPSAYAPSARHAVMAQLYTQMVREEVARVSYEAQCALIGYSLSAAPDGFSVSFAGVGDGMLAFANVIFDAMAAFSTIEITN